jgi:hypothetical protein
MIHQTPQTQNDEGAFFVANNAQTGVAMTTTLGFSATAPFLLIQNTAAVGGKKIYLDYVDLVTTAAGSAASGLSLIQAALVIDDILRYASGGTSLAPKSANMAVAPVAAGVVYAGPVAAAAGANARTLCGLRTVRPTVSATVADVVGETKHFVFAGGAKAPSGVITVASPNVISMALPPVIIGPQQSALLYLFYAAGTTPVAASYAPEVGWSEH